jgi:hypothetical protein
MNAWLAFGAGFGVGYLAHSMKARRASGRPSTTQNAARTLLQAERAIERFRPVLTPMAEGRTPNPRQLLEVLR